MSQALQPADSILAIDVGNTRIGLALWDADGLHHVQRVEAVAEDQWDAALAGVWAAARGSLRVAVCAAVAPATAAKFLKRVEAVCGVEPLRIRADLPLPMPIDVESPDEVGLDRICSAAAAYERLGVACAVASFGTAITIDFVSEQGVFRGGAILPGLEMSLQALNSGTAALPRVALSEPPAGVGRCTRDAILVGVVYGAVGAMREIVERHATREKSWPTLVVTGGNAALLRDKADFVDAIVPDLSLVGISLAYRRAAKQA